MQTNIELEIPNKQAATKQQKHRAVPNKHTKNLCVCVSNCQRMTGGQFSGSASNKFSSIFLSFKSNSRLWLEQRQHAHSWLNWFIHVQGIQFASKLERHGVFFLFSSASWMWNRAPVLNRVLSTGELYCVVLYEYIRDWGCWYFLILGFVSATANNNINIWLIYIRLPSEWHIAETIRKIEGSSSLLHERIFFFSNKKRCLSQAHFILRIFLLLWIEAGLKRVMGIKLRRCIQNMNEKKKSVSIDWRYDWSSHHDGINHLGDSLAFQDKKLQRFF